MPREDRASGAGKRSGLLAALGARSEIRAAGVALDPPSLRHHRLRRNANEAASGEELVVPHDEVELGGQEELYLVLRGHARFLCDGEEVELRPVELLYVRPEVKREAVALETPTVVFMVGGVPGGPYRPWPGDTWT